MSDPTNDFQVVHTLWTAVITIAGAIVAFFTKRLIDEVDKKADQTEVNELRDSLKAMLARQDVQHAGNTQRLDQIIMELGRNNR